MSLLRTPAFQRLWLSSVAFAAAQGMERVLTAWLALQLGAGPLAIGAMFAMRMLPSLLFGLAAGTVADQISRVRMMQLVALAAMALTAGFGGLVGLSGGMVWQVMAYGFLAGCVQVFDTPARQALVIDVAPGDAIQRALALNALAARLAPALGALAGGALIAQLGVAGGYLLVAGGYLLVALLAGTIHLAADPHARAARPPFRQAMADAARLIVNVPQLRTLVIAGVVCEIFGFSHMSAVPLFAQDVLMVGPEGLGALSAALTGGGALGVALLSLLPERVSRRPLLGATFVAYGLAILAFAGARSLPTAVVALALTGCCAASFDVLQQTLIQLTVPAAQRGRAVGIWVLSIGSAPVGHLEMGALIAASGVPLALAANGAVTLLAAAVLLICAPGYRWARKASAY